MSVVNKMLQDLETRKQAQSNSAHYQPPANRRYGLWIVGVLPLALIVAIIYWLWPLIWDATETDPATDIAGVAQQTLPAPAVSQASTTSNKPETPSIATPASRSQSQPEQMPAPQTKDPATNQDPAPQPSPQQASVTRPNAPQDTDAAPRPQSPSTSADKADKPIAFSKTAADDSEAVRWQQLKARVTKAMAEDQDAEAIAALQQMLTIQPDHHQVRRNLAGLLLKDRAVSRAELLLVQGVERYPQEPSLLQSLARFYHQQNQTDKALILLKSHEPNILGHADYIQLRARLAQQQQDYQQAQQDYALLNRYQPDNIKWRLGLAVSLDQTGQHQAATEVYRWLLEADTPPQIHHFVQQRLTALGG